MESWRQSVPEGMRTNLVQLKVVRTVELRRLVPSEGGESLGISNEANRM